RPDTQPAAKSTPRARPGGVPSITRPLSGPPSELKAVDAGVVGCERAGVNEGTVRDRDRSWGVASWVAEDRAVADAGGESGEADAVGRGGALPDRDQVEEPAGAARAEGDVGSAGRDRDLRVRGEQGAAMVGVAQLDEQVPLDVAPVRPVPATSLVCRVHRALEVAAGEEEAARSGDDRVVGHEARLLDGGEDDRVRRQDRGPGDL